ncbi:Redox-sensing transcriptional repressor Rex [subsurface metagenome]
MKLSRPSVRRLCMILGLLEELEMAGVSSISSAEMGARIGAGADTLRKDFSRLGEIGGSPLGYPVEKLRLLIEDSLLLNRQRRACVVGLGDTGFSLLSAGEIPAMGYTVVAGFDSSINRLELLQTEIPLHPLHEIARVVRADKIQIAIVTNRAREAANRLIEGGIQGILNLTSAILSNEGNPVWIRNLGLIEELRFLTAVMDGSKPDGDEPGGVC